MSQEGVGAHCCEHGNEHWGPMRDGNSQTRLPILAERTAREHLLRVRCGWTDMTESAFNSHEVFGHRVAQI
jgi:hypothetical protein